MKYLRKKKMKYLRKKKMKMIKKWNFLKRLPNNFKNENVGKIKIWTILIKIKKKRWKFEKK